MAFDPLIFLIFLLLLPNVRAQNNGTFSVGSTLTADNTSSTTQLLSPNGDFAFGFRQLETDHFLLAIWYNKIHEETVIWYANGDNLAPRGSSLKLDNLQGLVLRSPQGVELWRANISSGTVSFGVMNDTGNFAVVSQNSKVLWDSFSDPTDTLVPTQILGENSMLSSRKSESNFSRGRFQFRLNQGDAVLNSINLVSNNTYDTYYDSGTKNDSSESSWGYQVILDAAGFMYILKRDGEKHYITDPTESFSADNFYYRAILNYDGVFTISYHPKDERAKQRWIVVETEPENICTATTISIGTGACGFNNICYLNNDQRPECRCPEGYSLTDPTAEYGSCEPDFTLGCQEGIQSSQEDFYVMNEIEDVDWPLSDFELYDPYDSEGCKDACLKDCLCVVSIFRDNKCWKKKLPLSNGRQDQTLATQAFIKLTKNNASQRNPDSRFQNKDQGTLITLLSAFLGSSVVVNFILVSAICIAVYFYKNHKIHNSQIVAESNLRSFTFREIVEATNNFKDELGRGSCGIVYKGTTEVTVAVKRLDRLLQDSDKEFKTEVKVIGQTHHKNLVRLIGYCNEGQHRILVYEFMSNGTLARFLFGESKPNWNQRVRIALGIGRGLFYLHEECFTQIIHCDIKPQNILLDEFYNVRISDFGISKLLMMDQSRTVTAARGTKGYVAPDWFRSAPITAKVDVYSFGVLLLEIICCRKNVNMGHGNEEKEILTDWALDCYTAGRLDVLLENDDEAMSNMKMVERFVMVAIWCLQEDISVRPTMKNAMLMLEGITPVEIPPSPCNYSSVSFSSKSGNADKRAIEMTELAAQIANKIIRLMVTAEFNLILYS